jgi:hypothetical protein
MIDAECGLYDTLDAQTALRVKDGTQRGLRDKNGHLKNRNTGYFRRADN